MNDDTDPPSTASPSGAGVQLIATFADYDGMLNAMRMRARERQLSLSSEENANVAGLPARYLPKLLGANPIRRVGAISLGPVLALLGVRLAMIVDEEALARYGSRLETRNGNLVHNDTVVSVLTVRRLRRNQEKGRRNRWAKLSPKQRAAWARKMNRLRWRKPRVTEANGAMAKANRAARAHLLASRI